MLGRLALLLLGAACLLQLASAQTTISISYTLNAAANTIYGQWATCFQATLVGTPYTLPSGYAYTGGANSSYSSVYLITGISQSNRTFVSAIGTVYSAFAPGIAAVNFTYAPSGITANMGNDNLLFVGANGVWTTSAYGIGFNITTTQGAAGSPGLPGFPKTARFNQVIFLKVASLSGGALQETGYGPLTIDGTLGAGSSYTPAYSGSGFGYASTATASTLGSTLPGCAALTSASYMAQSFCYILYPHDSQNGNYSIAASGILYTSTSAYSVPGSQTGSPNRMAYYIYGMNSNSVTRTFIDQYGTTTTTTGAILQGPGGDGGTDNLLYTAVNASDSFGGLVDGDGFTYTWYNGTYFGVPTPGDPTPSYAMNFYYETNYREAAEPWHEDEEYAALGTSSFTYATSTGSVPSCVANTFPYTTRPANLNTAVVYNFCSYITSASSGAWSVLTNGTLSVTPTVFTSFATNNNGFYQIGLGITGQRTYTSGSTVNTVQITGLLSPGGDGQNNNKLYNGSSSNPAPFDNGGWSYYVSGVPTIPGVTDTTTYIVRLYYNNGLWTEQALPSFQTESPSSSSSYFTYQLASQGPLACGPNAYPSSSTGRNSGTGGNAAAPQAGATMALLLAGAAAAVAALLL